MKLLHYIKGNRKGKSAHQLEKEAMSDPFLRDALDGYDSIKSDHAKKIDSLQKRISRKTQHRNVILSSWIAACLVVLLGVATYLFMPEQKEQLVSQEIKLTEKTDFQTQEEADFEAFKEIRENKPQTIPSSENVDKMVAQQVPATSKAPLPSNDFSDIQEETRVLPNVALIEEVKIEKSDARKDDFAKVQADESMDVFAFKEISSNDLHSYNRVITPEAPVPAASEASAPPLIAGKVVKGKIVDEYGEPIIGASVYQKGTSNGTISDMDGNFELYVDSLLNNELSIAYIGYKPANTKIKDNMLIAMHEDAVLLEEAVIVGYGAAKKQEAKRVSSKPQPVIGMKAFQEYLKKNVTQPTDEACASAKGKVVLSFYIDENGRPYTIQVKKSLCPSADQIAVDLVSSGGNWTPGSEQVEIEVRFFGK